MNKIYIRRLLKLAEHLEGPKRNRLHPHFNFSFVSVGQEDDDGNYCGSAGCALGECPAVFPRSWKVIIKPDHDTNTVRLKKNFSSFSRVGSAFESAKQFFGITQPESFHLFTPGSQQPDQYGGKFLYSNATAKQVARNIRAFIKVKEKGR